MTYKVLVQQGSTARFELVEAPDIKTAEQVTGGIVVSLVVID